MNKIITLVLCMLALNSKAQSLTTDKGITTLKEFYKDYITTLSQDDDERQTERKLAAIKTKYCTLACLKQFRVLVQRTDADPFVKAQDMDQSVLRTLTITKDPRKMDRYRVKYADADNHETTTIYVTLKQQNGVLKIDHLE